MTGPDSLTPSELRRDRVTVAFATLASLTLGFAFLLVWSPLPWGWRGIDRYYERALSLARGGGFPTLDVPAGYAIFLAVFYRLFGDHPFVPLTAQVLLNALVPWMTYRLVRMLVDRRTAALSALLVGLFSFNTMYATTQASDSVCNVLFVAAILALAIAWKRNRLTWFVLAGTLLAIAPQFRPNLILFPPLAAVMTFVRRPRSSRRALQALVILLAAVVVTLPWMIRNYRLTGEIIPATTHGSVQLWYGTLQVGPYLHSRVYNHQSYFEEWPFPTSTIADRPIVVIVRRGRCVDSAGADLTLTWWTDRRPARMRSSPRAVTETDWTFEIPGQPSPTAVYYYLSSPAAVAGCAATEGQPAVYFITTDPLADPDRHGDLLDVFDVARLTAHLVWRTPVPHADRMDATHDGVLDINDLQAICASLLAGQQPAGVAPLQIASAVEEQDGHAVLRFVDGSTLRVPRNFDGRFTDIETSWRLAYLLLQRVRPISQLSADADLGAPVPIEDMRVPAVDINRVFFRADPDSMHRYTALAMDNIRRDPLAFARAYFYRAYRVFVIEGGIDVYTVTRFKGDAVIFALAHAASLTYFLLFLAGAAITVWRRRVPLLLLTPPAYLALTIAPVLTNMRYSVTMQPFVLAVAAIATLAAFDALARLRSDDGAQEPKLQ